MTPSPTQPPRDHDSITVSVIIPVYNGERYLAQAIDSVLGQTCGHVQVVVIDDGSTDCTPELIAGYGDRITTARQVNSSASAARNHGVALAGGSLLSFLDADDRWRPEKLARQLPFMLADPALDMCDCHTRYFWSEELGDEAVRRDGRFNQPFWRQVLAGHISTWLIRRTLWDRVGPFPVGRRYAEDLDWYTRALDMGMKRHTLADVLTERRLHDRNKSGDGANRGGDDMVSIMKAHLDRMRRRTAD